MKSIFDTYSHLWPAATLPALKPLLSQVPTLRWPQDFEAIKKVGNPRDVVIAVTNAEVRDMVIELCGRGFEHCVQTQRDDFAHELLASALMVARPEAFKKNPIPFFFNGFKDPGPGGNTDTTFVMKLPRASEKHNAMEKLDAFLDQKVHLAGIKDICTQTADELLSNALYSAPVDSSGKHVYQDVARTTDIVMPENRIPSFFACYNDTRVIVGTEDLYGSLGRASLMKHLDSTFGKTQASTREVGGGAGIGFKYLIENCSSFYIYAEEGKRTMVACAFIQSGIKANIMTKKHLHIGMR